MSTSLGKTAEGQRTQIASTEAMITVQAELLQIVNFVVADIQHLLRVAMYVHRAWRAVKGSM